MPDRERICIGSRPAPSGFSMVEIVAVVAILGILTASAVAVFNTEDVNRYAEVQQLENTLRYAQLLAMGDDVVWNVDIDGDTYELQRNCTAQADDSRQVRLPGMSSTVYEVPNGINAFGSINVVFNTRGQPSDCDGVALTNDVTVQVYETGMSTGSYLEDITITQNTGFIQ